MELTNGAKNLVLAFHKAYVYTLGLNMLNQLPQSLQDPVAIYESQTQPGRIVALVDMTLNGKSVVVPVEVDGFGRQNNVMIDSNAIVSVFAKNNAVSKQLNEAIKSELKGNVSVFYLNNKRAAALLQKAGLQLPSVLVRNNGYIHSIRDNGSNVKPKFKMLQKVHNLNVGSAIGRTTQSTQVQKTCNMHHSLTTF